MKTNKELEHIREKLKGMAEKEALKWFRIARKAVHKGCSGKLVAEIRNEAFWLHDTVAAYPERLIEPGFEREHKFIFRI